MKSLLMSMALICALVGQVLADDPKPKDETPAVSAAEKIKANPDDKDALVKYVSEGMGFVITQMLKDPDAAEKRLKELSDTLGKLEPTTDEAKANIKRYQLSTKVYASRIELARTSLADLEAKLDANPGDAATISLYVQKILMTASSLARSQPNEAEEIVNAAKARAQKAIDATDDEATKKRLKTSLTQLNSIQRTIDAGKKQLELIGKDAAPLQVESWVNGSPLTDAELKGKVVMLDFWAVWCGPCIATFPHLREWQEQYADKGLVIIGLTRYYNYAWDAEANRASRSKDAVEPADERTMLEKFAAEHKLQHRFGLQKESTMSEFYGVTGIPHCVVIDQQGKIRLMRIGSGEQNAKDVSEMLEKLLGAPTAAGSSE